MRTRKAIEGRIQFIVVQRGNKKINKFFCVYLFLNLQVGNFCNPNCKPSQGLLDRNLWPSWWQFSIISEICVLFWCATWNWNVEQTPELSLGIAKKFEVCMSCTKCWNVPKNHGHTRNVSILTEKQGPCESVRKNDLVTPRYL